MKSVIHVIIIAWMASFAMAEAAEKSVGHALVHHLQTCGEFGAAERRMLQRRVTEHASRGSMSFILTGEPSEDGELIAVAMGDGKDSAPQVLSMLEDLLKAKICTVYCRQLLEELGLQDNRLQGYDEAMGTMVSVDDVIDVFRSNNEWKCCSDASQPCYTFRVKESAVKARLGEMNEMVHRLNRIRLRNAIMKQLSRELEGFLRQALYSGYERLSDARRCLAELEKMEKVQQERYPQETLHDVSASRLAARYCVAVSLRRPQNEPPETAEMEREEAFMALSDQLQKLDGPWYRLVIDYATMYHRTEDLNYMKSIENDWTED